jgi:LysM repeat protein
LNKIAAEHGVTVQAILAANPGLNPNLIYPGQVINIPAGDGSTSSSSSSASTSSASGTPSTYTVQRGDWIYAIARKFNVTVAALIAANPGINPNLLYPGQQLNIPGGATPGTPSPSAGTYVVKPGDTLFSIAVKFRTTVYAFQIKNNLANPHFIYPGQVLIVPQ